MINYYTDGSCSPNPGPGGWAVIKDTELAIIGYQPMATNIQMEGSAILAALRDANGQDCQIYTDSEFWVNVITKWARSWEANDWLKKSGEIKNIEMVKEIYQVHKESSAQLIWVRGHVGNANNETADKWANRARVQKTNGKFIF